MKYTVFNAINIFLTPILLCELSLLLIWKWKYCKCGRILVRVASNLGLKMVLGLCLAKIDLVRGIAMLGLSLSLALRCTALLSAQCISSIGQIIKSVYVSVCEWVSESVCHTKGVERSTDRNLSSIFTKLATKVESQEMWLPIVFGGNPKYFYPPNRKWN